MRAEWWAICSAAAWAVDSILVRKGARYSNPSTAAFLSFLLNTVVMVPYIFHAYPAEIIFHRANLFFVASGVLQPAMVRVLFYMGIVRLGVARAAPLRGTSPLFSMAIAFVVLAERPGSLVYAGAVLTVAGSWLVSYRREGEARWRTLHLLFPIGAAMIASISQNIRKLGLIDLGQPIVAATITTATSLVCLAGSLVLSGNARSLQFSRGALPYYVAAAVFALAGQLFTFVALDLGEVSIVSPLVNTTPLFVIGFAALFLRGEEKINKLVLTGAVLLVAGIALIAGR